MLKSFEAYLSFGLMMGACLVNAACELDPITCKENATCGPSTSRDGGADVSIDAGETDAASVDDLSAESGDAFPDVKVDDKRDSTRGDDADAGSNADVRRDGVDAPANDVWQEPDACDPGTSKSPTESACLISEKYGVFVSPQGSDMTGIGERSAPYKTLAKALQSAKNGLMRVYACDDGTGYGDALTLDATLDGMSLYGGFECAGWTYATTRRARVHPASGTALRVTALTAGLTIEDFEFDSADAAMGESSIGAIVEEAVKVVLRGVKIVAGKGGGGEDGVDGAKAPDTPAVGPAQVGYPVICPTQLVQQNGGAWGGPSVCGSGGGSGGSRGGNGGIASRNTDGTNGYPGDPRTEVDPANVDNGGSKGPAGADGAAGSVGKAGEIGIAESTAGTFSASGYAPPPRAGNGKAGYPGQGGGGGGASNARAATNCIGASGGAGGMGGCGGSAGTGGGSGGASVALLSWQSAITLDRCELIALVGGAGGKGGNGGMGGVGGMGAPGGAGYESDAGSAPDAGSSPDAGHTELGPGGNGGPGGKGGNGGSGAGGNGAPSHAIVFKGTTPAKLNGTLLTHGLGGAGGIGGSVDTLKAPDGLVGISSDEQAAD